MPSRVLSVSPPVLIRCSSCRSSVPSFPETRHSLPPPAGLLRSFPVASAHSRPSSLRLRNSRSCPLPDRSPHVRSVRLDSVPLLYLTIVSNQLRARSSPAQSCSLPPRRSKARIRSRSSSLQSLPLPAHPIAASRVVSVPPIQFHASPVGASTALPIRQHSNLFESRPIGSLMPAVHVLIHATPIAS